MELTKKARWIIATKLLIVLSVLTISVVGLYTFASMAIEGILALLTAGKIDFSKFSLIVLVSLFIASGFYIYNEWKKRATFIMIAENHTIVDPVDRRDEFLEIAPSYFLD